MIVKWYIIDIFDSFNECSIVNRCGNIGTFWNVETGHRISRGNKPILHLCSMSCESESGDAFNDTLGSFWRTIQEIRAHLANSPWVCWEVCVLARKVQEQLSSRHKIMAVEHTLVTVAHKLRKPARGRNESVSLTLACKIHENMMVMHLEKYVC